MMLRWLNGTLGDAAGRVPVAITMFSARNSFAPRMPSRWKEFALRYRYRETYYDITVCERGLESMGEPGVPSMTVDGVAQQGDFILLADDRCEHRVEVRVTPATHARQRTPV